jgi:hypothetical protein
MSLDELNEAVWKLIHEMFHDLLQLCGLID